MPLVTYGNPSSTMGATENAGMDLPLPNLLVFMKHLQNVTADNMSDMERVRNTAAEKEAEYTRTE